MASTERTGRDPAVAVGVMDRATIERLFDEHYAGLCSFAMTILRSRDDAEDVVQQVFTNVWRNRHAPGVHTSIRAYLYRAVRNEALNRIRGGRSTLRLHSPSVESPLTDPAPDPAQRLITDETAARLHAALDQLGPRTREILRLRWLDGLSHAEIADTLGITRKAVESGITRGLRALRELIDQSD